MYDIKKMHKAETIEEALAIMKMNKEATIVSGGTDVMIKMKERKLKEAEILSIGDIRELSGISMEADGTIVIKAATRFIDIITSEIISGNIPVLAKACNQIGSPQIRNIATIGGNICNGAVSADVVTSLLVMDAELKIVDVDGGERLVDIKGFHVGPGKTCLKTGSEILTEVRIRKDNYENFGFDYFKYGKRNAMEIATLGCATGARLSVDKRTIEEFKIAYSVAAPTPRRCPSLEKMITGREVSEDTIKLIRPENIEELQPRDSWRASKEFRLQLIKETGRRMARSAIEEKGGSLC